MAIGCHQGPFRRTDRRKARNCHCQLNLIPREHQQVKFRALSALAASAGVTASPEPPHCLFLWGGGDLPELGLRGTCTVPADILLKRRGRSFMSTFYEMRLHRVHWYSPELQKMVISLTTTKRQGSAHQGDIWC